MDPGVLPLRKAVHANARCRRLVKRAERLKSCATSERDLYLVECILRRALSVRGCAVAVHRQALEKLTLLLCQQPAHARARALSPARTPPLDARTLAPPHAHVISHARAAVREREGRIDTLQHANRQLVAECDALSPQTHPRHAAPSPHGARPTQAHPRPLPPAPGGTLRARLLASKYPGAALGSPQAAPGFIF